MRKGEHWIIDIYDFPNLSVKKSLEILVEAARAMACTIVDRYAVETPRERVARVIIDESHLIIHDYKNGEAALDIFTCGGKDNQIGFDYIQRELGFENYEFRLRISRLLNSQFKTLFL